MGVSQPVLARIESSLGKKDHSPSLNTLRRYANACGMKLVIQIVESNTNKAVNNLPIKTLQRFTENTVRAGVKNEKMFLSLTTLRKYAEAVGCELEIKLTPKKKKNGRLTFPP